MRRQISLLCILLVTLFSTEIKAKKSISIDDFLLIKKIVECDIAPDKKFVAYVVEQPDHIQNDYISNIWLYSSESNNYLQLTTGNSNDTHITWSPDSRFIAFQSDRSNINQIWIINISGGEAWAVTDFPEGAYSPKWSPNGKYLTFLSNHSSNNFIKTPPDSNVKSIKNLRYRTDTRYASETYTHIYLKNLTTNVVTQLTHGTHNHGSVSWSNDSRKIAFISNRYGDPHLDDNTDIFTLSLDDLKLSRITDNPGPDISPIWAPDDKTICYLSRPSPNDFSSVMDLHLFNLDDKMSANLTINFDYNISHAKWSSKRNKILFLADVKGNSYLYEIDSRNYNIKKLISGNQEISNFVQFHKNSFYVISTNNLNPSDLFYYSGKNVTPVNISNLNSSLFQKLRLSNPEDFYFSGADGTKIHGWLMKPTNNPPHDKCPLILQIHGGPHWNYGNRFNFEFQLLAAEGYYVFYCNPRLSTGYGEEFAKAGLNDWGGKDVEDIMLGLEYILKNNSQIDSSRIGITGGSYGGYLTNWIISHYDRFKAAVAQRSITNLISFYGTTDVQGFFEHEFGIPWENNNYQLLLEKSPIYHAHHINTPLLIIHSEKDYRVPISQAEELFTILKRNNKETLFLRYQDEGHELSRHGKPLNRIHRLKKIVSWFNKYI